MDTNKKIVVTQVMIIRETPIDSVIADVFTFGLMFGLILANHKWLGGVWVVDFMMVLLALIAAEGMTKKSKFTFNSKEDAVKFLEEE